MARAEVVWQDATGTARVSPGKLEDLSDGGLGVRVRDEIYIGAKLIVRIPLGNFPGTVRQCRRQGDEYVLGIQRDNPARPPGG